MAKTLGKQPEHVSGSSPQLPETTSHRWAPTAAQARWFHGTQKANRVQWLYQGPHGMMDTGLWVGTEQVHTPGKLTVSLITFSVSFSRVVLELLEKNRSGKAAERL